MEERAQRRPRMRRIRRKFCAFCAEKTTGIDYKDVAKLRKFISESGKIAQKSNRCLRKASERAGCSHQESKSHGSAPLYR